MFFAGIADEASVSIDGQLKAHTQLGWTHIEIRNVEGVSLTDLCDEAFQETAEAVRAAGMNVCCFAAQLCNWSRPITKHPDIDRHELLRAIPRMQALGCSFIRTMSYPNAGWPEERWREEVIARLKVLAGIAEDGGVILVHENCDGWGGLGPEQTLELVERVDSPGLKLVWDTGNPVFHSQDPWAYYEAVREHIVHVHIKDGEMLAGDNMRYSYPGEGNARVREVIGDLLGRGYDGGFSIEPHLAAIVHEGKAASESENAYDCYVQYGRRLMSIVEEIRQSGS